MRQEIEITADNWQAIMTGKICPYCGKHTVIVDSKIIYGKSYGPVYYCAPCNAYVGCHKGTNKALGRLADEQLRTFKKDAHAWFDPIWQRSIKAGMNRVKARSEAYDLLAKEMGLSKEDTHIGMFNVEQCKQVIEVCKKIYKTLVN